MCSQCFLVVFFNNKEMTCGKKYYRCVAKKKPPNHAVLEKQPKLGISYKTL